MKFKQNVVEQFLWESYDIDFWKYLIRRLEESDESKIREIGKNVILQHRFLIRRVLDPGFRYHILDQIKKDKSAVKMAELYIEKLLLDGVHFDECKTFNPNPKNDCNNNLNRKTVDENLKHMPGIEIDFENIGDGFVNIKQKISDDFPTNNLKTSIEYFDQRYKMAREEGDELTAIAIKHVIYEYETDMFPLFDLNKRRKFYWENVNKEVIFDWLRYGFENITHTDIYQSTSPSDYLYPGNILSWIGHLEFEENLVSLLERFDIPTTNQSSERIYDLKYTKFLSNAFSIASLIWFNSLDLKEKEKLLNRHYNLDVARVTELIDKIAHGGSDKIHTLNLFAMECLENGFFDIARIAYEYIHNHSDDPRMMSASMDNIGNIHREKMDFEGALEYYKKAQEYANKIQINRKVHNKKNAFEFATTRKYVTVIESLRVSEMEYMLGKTDIANKLFSEVQGIAQKSNINERLSISWNLACTFKRTGQYEKEYLCLDELAELSKDRRNDLVKKADERLLFLNKFFNNHDFKLDNETVKGYDLKEKKDRILKIAGIMKKSFQFEREMEYLRDALSIDNDPNLRLKMALCYYKLNKMDAAEVELKRAISDTKKPEILTFCHLYLAFIHFKHNKNDNGFIELEKSIKCGILCEEIDSITKNCIIQLLPLKKEELLKQALERILNIVNAEYSDEHFISLILNTSMHLSRCGVINHAVYFTNIALDKSRGDSKLKVLSLRVMAEIYFIMDDTKKCVKYLKDAIDIDSNLPYLWEEMAATYATMLDYEHAEECIDKALAIKPENGTYKELKQHYSELGQNIINFNKITDEDVKKYFFTADHIVFNFTKLLDEKEFDFSMSLVSYGKGLETMLHNRISKQLRRKIHREYETPIADKYFNDLPRILRNVLGIKEQTIQLGSWKYIFDECEPNSKNDIIKKSRDYFAGKLNKNKELIFAACNIVSEYRNGAAHYASKPKDEILKIRKEIIGQINNIINILYI